MTRLFVVETNKSLCVWCCRAVALDQHRAAVPPNHRQKILSHRGSRLVSTTTGSGTPRDCHTVLLVSYISTKYILRDRLLIYTQSTTRKYFQWHSQGGQSGQSPPVGLDSNKNIVGWVVHAAELNLKWIFLFTRSVLWPRICRKCVCGPGPHWGSSRRSPRPPSRLKRGHPSQTPLHSAPRPLGSAPRKHNFWLRHWIL